MSASEAGILVVGKRTLKVSNPGKPLYPTGFTKGEVVDYYSRIAEYMIPHIKGRAITMVRFPNGTAGESFFEKRCPTYKPSWMNTTHMDGKEGGVDHCTFNEPAALAWAANLAALEIHILLSKGTNPNRPSWLVLDLDPGAPATMKDCAEVALRMKKLFDTMKLQAFIKTTGKKGLHLYLPLNTPTDYGKTKSYARALAMLFEKDDPARVTSSMKREIRAGKVFIDWSQNDEHKTTAAVYTLRAWEKPTVSTPLTWDEIKQAAKGKFFAFEAPELLKRVANVGDLFSPMLTLKQKLPTPPSA